MRSLTGVTNWNHYCLTGAKLAASVAAYANAAASVAKPAASVSVNSSFLANPVAVQAAELCSAW